MIDTGWTEEAREVARLARSVKGGGPFKLVKPVGTFRGILSGGYDPARNFFYKPVAAFSSLEEARQHAAEYPESTHIAQTHEWQEPSGTEGAGMSMAAGGATGFLLGGPVGAAAGVLLGGAAAGSKGGWISLQQPIIHEKK